MTDERRRIIYELLVEAKNTGKAAKQAEAEFNKVQQAVKKFAATMAVGFTFKGIADALSNAQKFNEQLSVLGITGEAAAAGLRDVQDIAFSTGQTVGDSAKVFQAAVEATQALGGSQKDATKLAEAFIRSTVAQGKSAADAAQQLDTLQFAIDKNNVKTKEFATLMKENEIFQQAAQQALGKTTSELLGMAKAGEIGREELGKILTKFQDLAGKVKIGITLDRVTESLKTMSETFVIGMANALGFGTALENANSGGLKNFLHGVRVVADVLGGLIRIIFNIVEAIGQMVIAWNVFIFKLVTDPKNALEVFDTLGQQMKENLEDVKASLATIANAGSNIPETPGGAMTPAEILAAQRAADEAEKKRAEREKAAEKDAAQQAKLRAIREEQERRAASERSLQEAIDPQAIADVTAAIGNKAEKELEAQRQIEKARERNASQLRVEQREIDKAAAEWEEWADVIEGTASTIQGAFEGLFTGATRNAREFFAQILSGLAQVFAAKAAQQATDWLMGLFPKKSERGNIFDQGALIPFAGGGVVGGPTLFPMRGGVGLMGEAGPEAILPLRRGSQGKLGVAGSPVNVEVINNTGVNANARVSRDGDRVSLVLEAAQLGASMAEERINRSFRSGYGATAQSVQRTYGLTRRL